ncbi:MAG TPA: TolC family protein, partial [Thermoanaerobaculia bacterium]|nr:TolC family protein [Thermoanaerobaculia bacterium]
MKRLVVAVVLLGLGAHPGACAETPVLTLDEAVRMAVAQNRLVKNAALQVDKAGEDLAAARTRRWPVFSVDFLAGELLTPVSFTFPRGAFGTFPGVGPFPPGETRITQARTPSLFADLRVAQPLTQLTRVSLGIQASEAGREIEREGRRGQEQAVAANVRKLYYGIVQAESALAVSDETLALDRELERLVAQQAAEQTVLRADLLDVQARRAQAEADRLATANAATSQKEQLNQILGRDVRTPFRAEAVPAPTAEEVDLEAARAKAVEARPEVRQARLKARQADLDRRMKRSEAIPDVSLSLTYLTPYTIDPLPDHILSLGFLVQWEPWDWGRKRHELAAKERVAEAAKNGVAEAESRVLVDVGARFRKLE